MEMRQASVETYVVHIYRREPGQHLVGVVEFPLHEKQIPFRSFAELQAILMQDRGSTEENACSVMWLTE